MTKICPSCGNKVDQKAKICPKCGHDFTKNLYENIPSYLGIMGIQPRKSQNKARPVRPVQPTSPLTRPRQTQARVRSVPQPQPVPVDSAPPTAPLARPKRKKPTVPPQPRPKTQATQVTAPAKATTPAQTDSVYRPPRKQKRQKQIILDRPTSHNEFHALHVIVGVIAALIALFAVFCVLGSQYYSEARQVAGITANLKSSHFQPGQVVTAKPAFKVTTSTLKPLQAYYQARPALWQKTQAALTKKHHYRDLKVVQKGTYWSLFPKYALQLPFYQIKVATNQAGTSLVVNGHHHGLFLKQGASYQKKLADLVPGKYDLLAQKGKQKVARSLNLWRDQSLTLNTRKLRPKAKEVKTVQNPHQMLEQLLTRSFIKPRASDFVNGKRNRDYYTLHAITAGHHARVKVRIIQLRQSGRQYHLNYRLTYFFSHHKRQVMAYINAVVLKNKNSLQIKKMGSGRVVSAN